MKCLLPYHATGQFVRAVQLMPLEGTMWAFLQPTQQSGAPVPRSSLALRCQRDQVWPSACRPRVTAQAAQQHH